MRACSSNRQPTYRTTSPARACQPNQPTCFPRGNIVFSRAAIEACWNPANLDVCFPTTQPAHRSGGASGRPALGKNPSPSATPSVAPTSPDCLFRFALPLLFRCAPLARAWKRAVVDFDISPPGVQMVVVLKICALPCFPCPLFRERKCLSPAQIGLEHEPLAAYRTN